MGVPPAKPHEKLSERRLGDEILWGRLVTCGRLAIGPCRLRGGPAAVTNRRAGCPTLVFRPCPVAFLRRDFGGMIETCRRLWLPKGSRWPSSITERKTGAGWRILRRSPA